MIEGFNPPIPRKYPTRYALNIASDNQVELLAFTWWICLEETGEWAKGKKLAGTFKPVLRVGWD